MMRGLVGILLALSVATDAGRAQSRRTENVVLIVTDGLRWQEVFRGAERRLMSRDTGGVPDTAALRRTFWREDQGERRAALLPFLWGTVAREGQLLGNADQGSIAHTMNPLKFSYPGYNELFTGWYDDRIDSNEYPPNPNVTVFEWLNARREYRGRVAAVATWDAFGRILNEERSGIPVLEGWGEPFTGSLAKDPRRATINELYRTSVRYWPGNAFDAPMQLAAKEYVRARKPRVLFLGYGETDEWAHSRRYDLLLQSARQVDAYIADLWAMMQGMSQYRGKTTFIITTDHGRGSGARDWASHGREVEGAEGIWMAVIGPDTPALGERTRIGVVTQSQVAATIAALLGLGAEYGAAAPKAGRAISEVLRP